MTLSALPAALVGPVSSRSPLLASKSSVCSIFSRATDGYNERPDHPMSTPNPDELGGPRPITADGAKVQDTIIALTQIFPSD